MYTVKEYVKKRKEEIKAFLSNQDIKPSFVIVQMNDDPASKAYVKGKLKDCEELNIKATLITLDLKTSEEDLLKLIENLNNNPDVHGFIVQMPLPSHINEDKVKLAICPKKDIDGFHPLSHFKACTPLGIINYLKANNFDFVGKNAVVIGRSNIVGKPMSTLLTKENMNVTLLHSKTSRDDMSFYIAHADLIVIAIGKAGFLDESFSYKKDAIVIDVGINRTEDGLKGDATSGLPVLLQTPVPGGVGLLTRLALIENIIKER